MMTRLAPEVPHWLRDIDATLPVTSQYVVHGNIRDRHLMPLADGQLELVDTVPALWMALEANGYQALFLYSQVRGLRVVPPEAAGTSVERVLADSDARLARLFHV